MFKIMSLSELWKGMIILYTFHLDTRMETPIALTSSFLASLSSVVTSSLDISIVSSSSFFTEG